MKNELFILKNVGKATYNDLCQLGIHSIAELVKVDPEVTPRGGTFPPLS